MSVEIDVIYNGGLQCTAVHLQSGAEIKTDAPKDNSGKGERFSPTDLVAAAIGSCILTIMGLFSEKNKLDIKGTKVHVVKEMADAATRRIGQISVTVTFPAGLKISDVERTKLERVVELCPVRQSLHPDIKIFSKFVYPD